MNVFKVLENFKTETECFAYLEDLRWPDGVHCPFCKSYTVYKRQTERRYICSDCNSSFSVLSGTIFHSTKLPLRKWIIAIALISPAKKGISSLQLSRSIGVNKNTAWYMQYRIRKAMQEEVLFNGLMEVDETYIGGKLANMHQAQKLKVNPKRNGMVHMVPVLGMLQRGGKTSLKMLNHNSGKHIKPILKEQVDPKSKIVTDGFGGYYGIGKTFKRHIRTNSEKKQRKWGRYHLANIEGFFSTIKRAIVGQYHILSKDHLQDYLNEISFKYNYKDRTFDLLIINALKSTARF